MAQRPSLKLKLSTAAQPMSSESVQTPAITPKIKLKFGSSTPKTATAPAFPTVGLSAAPKPKPARKTKKDGPPRLSAPKKRNFATQSEDGELLQNAVSAPLSGPKKIKLTARAPTTPFIRMKAKGKPPSRPLGVGYDSEASDREVDPAIEEEFILRMAPGEDCEYLRKAVEEKRWGPRSEGGADIRMKFLTRDGRRAVLTVRGNHYAACLVDLPCIIEGMKSWDRRGWWKSADICQLLLVLGRVAKEDEALDFHLPGKELDKVTWQYAHGLTPPMRWVRRRRFRKRVSNRTIEAVEEEVERLCRMDEECEGKSRYEVLDTERLSRGPSFVEEDEDCFNMLGNAGMQGGSEFMGQDADGDADEGNGYFDSAEVEDDGLEADLEMAMMESDIEEESQAIVAVAANPTFVESSTLIETELTTPAAATPAKETTDDESSGSENDDNESIDEDVLERQADLQRQREEIADLEAAIKSQNAELERVQNSILRTKLVKKIQSLKSDLELKMAAIGEGGED